MTTETLSTIQIDLTLAPVINFAMQENHVPVVKQLILTNAGELDYEDLTVEISSEPEFSIVWKASLDRLKVGESYTFGAVPLRISAAYLAGLTERLSGRLNLKIMAAEQVISSAIYDIDLLAYDQWNGAGSVPELLAAFVTPNHPEIPAIIRNASVLLQQWTGDPSFNAYQTQNPDRVKKQMAAIYEAIAGLNLIYCAVPASLFTRQRYLAFKQDGQYLKHNYTKGGGQFEPEYPGQFEPGTSGHFKSESGCQFERNLHQARPIRRYCQTPQNRP